MKVSVHMITYNHEKYIEKAIQSVLNQKGDFELELVIGEDVSTDNTRNLIYKIYKKYPNKIKLNFHTRNVGATNNFKSTLELCTGKYVAILEGDDYWIDEYKLQKEIDFLENNLEYSMCFTKAKFFFEDENRYEIQDITYMGRDFNVEDLLKGNFIFHPTIMFRNIAIEEYPKWLWEHKILDYPMNLLRGIYGCIGYIDDITTVYRIHKGGISRTNEKVWWYLDLISILEDFNRETNKKHNSIIDKRIKFYYSHLAVCERNRQRAIEAFRKGLFSNVCDVLVTKKKVKFLLNLVRGKHGK